jgi:hypothetical protein
MTLLLEAQLPQVACLELVRDMCGALMRHVRCCILAAKHTLTDDAHPGHRNAKSRLSSSVHMWCFVFSLEARSSCATSHTCYCPITSRPTP